MSEQLIERFYEAFAAGDADAMEHCYRPDVCFSDPVFPDLRGTEVMKMWRMLLGRSDDLAVELRSRAAKDREGTAHWTARYTFSRTGRHVVNEVDARFRFEGGLIVEHRDSFDFWKWSRMALGPPGLLFGWSPILKKKIRAQSSGMLARSD